VAELTHLRMMMPGMSPTSTSNREGDGVWNVNSNKAETGKAVVDGFFNAAGLADFVSTKGRSISKMLDY